MIGSSLSRRISRRPTLRGKAAVVAVATSSTPSLSPLAESIFNRGGRQHNRQHRFMGSGSKKSKKHAMRKQRKLNPTSSAATESPSSSHADADNSYEFHPSSPATSSAISGSRVIADPLSASSFDGGAGLSKLQLRPNINNYLEKYDLSEKYDGATTHGGAGAVLSWESNKTIVPPGSINAPLAGNAPGLLLRNSSSLASGKGGNQHRNILNDEDDDGFVIDRDSMFDPTIHLPHAPKDWKGYEAATPLSDFLMQRIGVSGQPISTAEYMRHALTHPLYGYYTSKEHQNETDGDDDGDGWDDDEYGVNSDDAGDETQDTEAAKSAQGPSSIFGRDGDFVTAPELSSVFGHSLCVWFMTVWQQEPMGKPPDVQFVELGPGRGTLMADLLELAHSSKLMDFGQSIRTVHLVEASRELRRQQQETLTNAVGHLVRLEFTVGDGSENSDENKEKADTTDDSEKSSLVNTIRIEWHDDFSSFQSRRDKSVPTMVIMQEFLDALPIHQFQKTDDGWRERMIDVVSADETNEEGVPVPTTPRASDDDATSAVTPSKQQLIPRLRQVLAPNVTPAVELLLSSSYDQYDHFPEGTVVEICPDALFLIQDVAKVLEESQGAALIIDYGEEGTTDTLRAFSRHQQVPLTSRPGKVDVTADVDFFALKNSLSVDALKRNNTTTNNNTVDGNSNENGNGGTVPSSIHAFGPVPQGEFLMKMGAGELTMNAIEKDETTEEQAQAFADALRYLVMPEQMGEKFKVLALSRKRDGLFGPAGIE